MMLQYHDAPIPEIYGAEQLAGKEVWYAATCRQSVGMCPAH
jgi:hypothetical protein